MNFKFLLFPIWLILFSAEITAQITSTQIDTWISTWPYDNPSKIDSILLWADQMERAAREINYPRGLLYATRMRGYFYDFSGDVEEATRHYLQFLENARRYKLLDDEISAITDLVYTYINTSQYRLAKELILASIPKTENEGVSARKKSILFNNLGVIYKRSNQNDSAALAYGKALEIKNDLRDSTGIADLKINLASLYVKLGNFAEAIRLSNENIEYLKQKDNIPDLIYNQINKAAGHYGLDEYEKTFQLLDEAVEMAKEIGNGDLLQVVYESLSAFYTKQGQYKPAYEYLMESNKYKVELINADASTKIAELRESFEAEQREKENLLLTTTLEVEKNRKRLYFWGLFAMALVAATIAWSWVKNREKNRQLQFQNKLIRDQKNKLTALNAEKNNLISVVSHDLSSPLSAIKIWAQGLTAQPQSDLLEAKQMILQTSQKALHTIRKILSIEEGEIRALDIEKVNVVDIVNTLKTTFQPIASRKGIPLLTPKIDGEKSLMTDREMLLRALENLLSNAIKFSPKQGTVTLAVREKNDRILFDINDQGAGITEEEQIHLFDKYYRGSVQPTANENSTGLGLSIVKRIADELGASVEVHSVPGEGSTFTFSIAC